jgi:hypothetical protein
LRNYYESGGHKKDDNLYDDEEYDLESEEDEEELDLELDNEDEDEELDLELEDEDEDLEEGIGISHTMKRGMNAPRRK